MDPQMTPEEIEKHLLNIEALFEKSLYRQAYDLGHRLFGPVSQWPNDKACLLGARILGHLGLYRLADAMLFKLWRRTPGLSDLAYYYISTVRTWRGPLKALDTLRDIRQRYQLSAKELAHLATEEASILMQYRDFSAAEKCLDAIPKGDHDRWVVIQGAQLKLAADEYSAALNLTEDAVTAFPDYRPAIQKYAHLLQLTGDTQKGIEVLTAFWEQSESWWVGKQLFDLLMDANAYQEASICLERLKTLPPHGGKEIDRQHQSMEADLLCAQEKYSEALPFLEQKSFFHSAVNSSIKKSRDDSKRRVLDVPFIRQANMTCAPASLTAVSLFWGREENQDAVIEAICYGGTQSYDERKWAIEKGWYTCEFDLQFESLKALIDRDIPVLLATVEPGSGHLQIIVGYDESMGTYLLRDPYYPRLQEFLITESEKYFAANGPRCMVMVPQDKKEQVKVLNLPSKKLYDALYRVNDALDKNDRHTAVKVVNKAKEVAPEHRITSVCERTLAFYDRDESAILNATEKLLKLFPEDVNFQLSRVSSLMELGSSSKALEYLEEIANAEKSHFLIRSRLANELRWDHQKKQETDKLYRELLKISPQHTQTLYGFAGTLWDKGEYEYSYQLYRFCTCLEDTHEGYAESFFKAARFHKRTEEAIDFLVDRFKRFGARSSGPIISLYNAFDSLERTKEGLVYLKQAIELRPEDGDLLLFAARKFLYTSQFDKALELLGKAKPHCHSIRFNEAAIEIYEAQLQPEKALAACKKIIEREPLNSNANYSYTRLLREANRNQEALNYVRQQLDKYPENAMLQRLLIQTIDPADFSELHLAHQYYCRSHPLDTWGWRGLSSVLIEQGEYQKALEASLKAIDINNRESVNYGYLGDAYIALNQRENAHNAFKKAIEISCDYGYAYERLLDTSLDIESQRQDLDFIHQELMSQISYGGGILDFQYIAQRYIDSERISEFLNHALEARPDLWQSWVASVIHLRQQNQCEKALALIDKGIKKFPLLPRLYFEKAEIYRLLHDDNAAIKTLQYTLELSPGWTMASNSLCQLYEKTGDLEAAIELQQSTIRRSPMSPSPYGFLADLFIDLDRKKEAFDSLEKAIERDVSYTWAWKKLYSLCKEKNDEAYFFEKLQKTIASWPENVYLIEVFAELYDDETTSIDLIKRYLSQRPHHLDLCIKLIHLYSRQNQFDEARCYVSRDYWSGSVPVAIQANEAWLYACEDDLLRAIDIMNDVATKNSHYYDAWRYLALWNARINNKDEVEKALSHCARLYPHDANVLCFCAEKLQEIGSESPDIDTYLMHAFELDPSDQYNALTYIDYVLEKEKSEEVKRALDLLLVHHQNPYVFLRSIQLSLLNKNSDEALSYFEKSLVYPPSDNSVVYNMWLHLEKAELVDKANSIILAIKDQDGSLDPMAGRCVGRFDISSLKLKDVEKKISQFSFDSLFEQRYIEAYLRYLINEKRQAATKLEKQILSFIKQDTTNWSLLAYLKFQVNNKECEAAELMKGLEKCRDVEAWILYYASMANRWCKHWEKGGELLRQAYALPADNYRSDILIWHLVDKLLMDEPVDCSPLAYLHLHEIEPISNYVLSSAKVLSALLGSNFIESYEKISPLLRQCQRDFQPYPQHAVLQELKKRMRSKLRESIPKMGLLKRLFWYWRLSSHF